ncbi:MAG TPA: hypothetical protein VLJ42_08905 [Solirubrobacteraceae bacterium]|nr:hypothetical protein [Solirubrobacteraceae bacterium]
MTKSSFAMSVGLLLALGMVTMIAALTGSSALAWGASNHVVAKSAHVLNATDNASLHYVDSSGSVLLEQGPASGTLPGTIKARLQIGATLTGSFTIYPRSGGTIRGRGSATLSSSGANPSFHGSLSAIGGSGRYSHAHGTARLYGVFHRRTYKLTIQTVGKLHY